MLLAAPREDDEGVIVENGDHAPEFVDEVGVRFAVGRRHDVSGMRAGASRTLLLSVNHNVTWLKTGMHFETLWLGN
jgi:hypothetical protein